MAEANGKTSSLLSRLPPGRHGLPREFVVENQRSRITAGMIAAVAEAGFQAVTISQIAEAAGVSRRTFYHYWKSKEACFAYVLAEIADHLRSEADRTGVGKEGADRLRAELGAVLGVFIANPDLAICTLETPLLAGEKISTSYRRALREAAARVRAAHSSLSEIGAEAAVGGTVALIARTAAERDAAEKLPALIDLAGLALGSE